MRHQNVYASLEFDDFCLNTESDEDKIILTNDYSVVSLKYISHNVENETITFFGFPLTDLQDYFIRPIRSSSLQIYSSKFCLGPLKMFNLSDVKCKMVKVGWENLKYVLIPLLHTLQFGSQKKMFQNYNAFTFRLIV